MDLWVPRNHTNLTERATLYGTLVKRHFINWSNKSTARKRKWAEKFGDFFAIKLVEFYTKGIHVEERSKKKKL